MTSNDKQREELLREAQEFLRVIDGRAAVDLTERIDAALAQRPEPPTVGCDKCGRHRALGSCGRYDCPQTPASPVEPPKQEPPTLQGLRDIIANTAMNRRDYEGDFGESYERDVIWRTYHAAWSGLVTATKMLQDLHNQTPLCWVKPEDVEFLSQGEPDVSDPADVELSPMEDASEGQTMPLYASPVREQPDPYDTTEEDILRARIRREIEDERPKGSLEVEAAMQWADSLVGEGVQGAVSRKVKTLADALRAVVEQPAPQQGFVCKVCDSTELCRPTLCAQCGEPAPSPPGAES